MSDEWNSYRCRVDGQPASIFLDMGIRQSAPVSGFDQGANMASNMRDGAARWGRGGAVDFRPTARCCEGG
jgi:hypothetical protein